jgi:hypothetical protein
MATRIEVYAESAEALPPSIFRPMEITLTQSAGGGGAPAWIGCEGHLGEGSGATLDSCISYYPESVSRIEFVTEPPDVLRSDSPRRSAASAPHRTQRTRRAAHQHLPLSGLRDSGASRRIR